MTKTSLLILFPLFLAFSSYAQPTKNKGYWNQNTTLNPFRIPLVSNPGKIAYEDLDEDGDPDLLFFTLPGDQKAVWIDDDDDMKYGDLVGDTDNDCLLIDRNKDGIFAGPRDISIDWGDENRDGVPDIQLIVSNGGAGYYNYFDWGADYMYVIDFGENDGILNYINWNLLNIEAWEHKGHSNFFTDYHGNNLFLKMHHSSYRIANLEFNWENPFIFYDFDNDGFTEQTIRLIDTPWFRTAVNDEGPLLSMPPEFEVLFKESIDWAGISWDLDNDNGPGNEFDLDMSIRFSGKGFEYSDQGHHFSSIKWLKGEEYLFYDHRWRKVNTLYYPNQDSAWEMIFNQGNWESCWFVFDEDDDCNRWERVEFYEPKDLHIKGLRKGGLDNNSQSDVAGDRGEWDSDNSGNGNLYLGAFDGRIHLHGAEWGAWRIDQNSFAYQGFGGLYNKWHYERLQLEPEYIGLVRYTDTDFNGFLDRIEYDLDGDSVFEETVSLKELGLSDVQQIYQVKDMDYEDFRELYKNMAEAIWENAMQALEISECYGLDTHWYSFWKNASTLQQKYNYGYWLSFYCYMDLKHLFATNENPSLQLKLDKAYYSGNWQIMNDNHQSSNQALKTY